jgi:hypothetical protein
MPPISIWRVDSWYSVSLGPFLSPRMAPCFGRASLPARARSCPDTSDAWRDAIRCAM